jgi:hypothetical protein
MACRVRREFGRTLLLVLVATSGCATVYQPLAYEGGYKNVQIDGHIYQVSFYGNAHTNRETVELYHLYRCAELTVGIGGDFFVLDDKGADTSFSIQKYGTVVSAETRYSKTAQIKIFKGQKPDDWLNAYDARAILKNLGHSIRQ